MQKKRIGAYVSTHKCTVKRCGRAAVAGLKNRLAETPARCRIIQTMAFEFFVDICSHYFC